MFSFFADFVNNLYCRVVVSPTRAIPQMVYAFDMKQEITCGCCVLEQQLTFVLLDLFESRVH